MFNFSIFATIFCLNSSKKSYKRQEGNPLQYLNAQRSVEQFGGSTVSLSPLWIERDQFRMMKNICTIQQKICEQFPGKFNRGDIYKSPSERLCSRAMNVPLA